MRNYDNEDRGLRSFIPGFPGGRIAKYTAGILVATGLVGASTLYNVGEGQRAVVLTGGQVTAVTGPGWHSRVPLYQSYSKYDAGKLSELQLKGLNIYYSPDAEAHTGPATINDTATANAQQYTVHDIAVRFTTNPEHTKLLHGRYQSSHAIESFVRDQIAESYKSVIRKIDPLKINTKRDVVGPETRELAQKRIDAIVGVPGAIKIDSVIFVDFHFEKGVAAAFEKANGERASIQAANYAKERQAVQVESERLAGEAQGARALAVAKANAEVIRLEGEALAKNPSVLQLRWIDAWKDGAHVPQVVTGNGPGSPFIFQLPTTGPRAAVQ